MPLLAEGGIDVRLTARQFRDKLVRLQEVVPEIAEEALEIVAQELLKDSRLFVPVLTGALHDSGYVEVMPTLSEARRVVRVIYPLSYAFKQHEIPYWHPSLGFYGAAKFLEIPLQRFASFYFALFAAEYERRLAQAFRG